MKNINITLIGVSLLALTFSFKVNAQSCTIPPTCETLGYKQSEDDCKDQYALKCPFDMTKFYCGGDVPVSCSGTHTLDSCPINSLCTSCADNGKYKFSQCALGYGLDENFSCTRACYSCGNGGYKMFEYGGIGCSGSSLELHFRVVCVYENQMQNTIISDTASFHLSKYFSDTNACQSWIMYQSTGEERRSLFSQFLSSNSDICIRSQRIF